MDRAFERFGVKRQLTLETPFSAAICALVEQGLGVGVVNPIAVRDFRRSGIAVRPFEPKAPFYGNALFPARHMNSVLIQAFLDIVSQEFADYDGLGAVDHA